MEATLPETKERIIRDIPANACGDDDVIAWLEYGLDVLSLLSLPRMTLSRLQGNVETWCFFFCSVKLFCFRHGTIDIRYSHTSIVGIISWLNKRRMMGMAVTLCPWKRTISDLCHELTVANVNVQGRVLSIYVSEM